MINADNSLDAWRLGSVRIANEGGSLLNLITTIEDPTYYDPTWIRTFSAHRITSPADNIKDVIDTIFPIDLRTSREPRNIFYDRYLRRHDRAMRWRRNRGKWGTYFERLIRFKGAHGAINQLETAIQKINSWPNRSITGITFHLSAPSLDTLRPRGAPCWHFGEILWREDDILDLVVVYRNHDFFNKTLGNFIALGQLLAFISEETNKRPGRLVCHSVRAYSEGSMANLRDLTNF